MTDATEFSPFLTLRRHLRVVHHIPGRIRLRVDAALAEQAPHTDGDTVARMLGAVEGIEDVRVNAAAGSVVVTYDPSRWQPQWWDTLVGGDEEAAVALLQQLLASGLAPALDAARQH